MEQAPEMYELWMEDKPVVLGHTIDDMLNLACGLGWEIWFKGEMLAKGAEIV